MNTADFLSILHTPSLLQNKQVLELEEIVQSFPYFQAARVLYLKALKNQNNFRYNKNLKITAIHIPDRSVLFDFITSDTFNNVVSKEEETNIINEIVVVDETVIYNLQKEVAPTLELAKIERTVDEIALESKKEGRIVKNKEKKVTHEVLEEASDWSMKPKSEEITINHELIKTIQFNKKDRFSFNQWLQLSSFKPIDRTVAPVVLNKKIKKKMAIIEEFISNKPKIKPSKLAGLSVDFDHIEELDNDVMMTETLAQLYIKQEKYSAAIEAYEILSLKIPEKSSFFADQIEKIRDLMS